MEQEEPSMRDLASIGDPTLQARIAGHITEWDVTVSEMRATPSSIILFGCRGDEPIVLKVVRASSDEWHGGEVLAAFDGHGIVRVLDAAEGAMLLELLAPGDELATLTHEGRDDEATEVIADIIEALARSHVTTDRFRTVEEWRTGFDWYERRNDPTIEADLVAAAHDEYVELCASQGERRLLHGDLHHYNILHDRRHGWTAIDPKGVVGETAFETGTALHNPFDQPGFYSEPDVIRRRVAIFASRLALDPDRILRWAFAQAVLSGIWFVQDGEPFDASHPHLVFARTIRSML